MKIEGEGQEVDLLASEMTIEGGTCQRVVRGVFSTEETLISYAIFYNALNTCKLQPINESSCSFLEEKSVLNIHSGIWLHACHAQSEK